MDRNKVFRNALVVILLIVILLSTSLLVRPLIAGFLEWYLSPGNDPSIEERKDLVQGLASAGQALAVLLTGAVGLIGLFFTWQNTNEARRSTQRTLELTEQGQITDRFTKAIEQLGANNEDGGKNVDIRMGGIHALARIARESEDDYEPIMEILTAYVRHHASYAPTSKPDESAAPPSETGEDTDSPNDAPPREDTLVHKDADIQAILNVIGQRQLEWVRGESKRIDLGYTDLTNAAFLGNWTGAWFGHAYMFNTHFGGADLRGAAFVEADLRQATFFSSTNLEGTDFQNASLEGASFEAVDLTLARDLTQEQIDQCAGYKNSKLPDGFQYPDHWTDSFAAALQQEKERGGKS